MQKRVENLAKHKLVFERDEYHRGMRIDQYTLPVQLAKVKTPSSSSSARTNKRNPGLISGSFKCVYATRQALRPRPEPPAYAPTRGTDPPPAKNNWPAVEANPTD